MLEACIATYHDGEPEYLAVVDRWTERYTPYWSFVLQYKDYIMHDGDAVEKWIAENGLKDRQEIVDVICRFNSGNPFVDVRIFDEKVALMFKMRFL